MQKYLLATTIVTDIDYQKGSSLRSIMTILVPITEHSAN